MTKLVYPKLSYDIVGALFEVYNQMQYGHREKIYQKALAEEFVKRKIPFKKELKLAIKYNNKIISHYYFDFLVDNKIVLEIKVAEDFYQKDINQLLSYIKHNNIKLGILAIFSKKGLKYRRILN